MNNVQQTSTQPININGSGSPSKYVNEDISNLWKHQNNVFFKSCDNSGSPPPGLAEKFSVMSVSTASQQSTYNPSLYSISISH